MEIDMVSPSEPIKEAEVATSPLPKKIEVKDATPMLTFPQAMEAVIAGKRVTKKEWDDVDNYAEMKDGFLIIHTDKDHQWTISEGDLTGNDYVII
jgi:hypothetical protein